MYQEKIVADTDVALRKEAEASKRALESLQKEMTENAEKKSGSPQKGGLVMKSTLVRIPPNQASAVKKGAAAAAAAAAIAPQVVTQVVDKLPDKDIKCEKEEGEQISLQLNEGSTAMSNYEEVLKAAGLPPDMPILMDSGDGNYVPISEEVLMNMVNSGVIQVRCYTIKQMSVFFCAGRKSTTVHFLCYVGKVT